LKKLRIAIICIADCDITFRGLEIGAGWNDEAG
jgi:hypothetical protein